MKPIDIATLARWCGGKTEGDARRTVCHVTNNSAECKAGSLFVALVGTKSDGHRYVGSAFANGAAAALVRNDYIAPASIRGESLIRVPDPLNAMDQMAAEYRAHHLSCVVAITGSNGKTTTKRMLDHIAGRQCNCIASPKNFNNAIGVALTLFQANPEHEFIIAELGTSHIGEIADLAAIVQPNHGVITMVSPAHLEGLHSVDQIAKEKESLLDKLPRDGVAILNADNQHTRAMAASRCGHVYTFGTARDATLRISDITSGPQGVRCIIGGYEVRLPTPGRHNAWNAAAALAAADVLGLDIERAARDLADYRPAPMRLEIVSRPELVIINDAYNANIASMRAALDVLAETPSTRKVFVCGDMLELGASSEELHRALAREILKHRVEITFTVGQETRFVADEMARLKARGHVAHYETSDAAAEAVAAFVRPGDAVLVKGSRGIALEKVVEALEKQQELFRASTAA